MKQDIVLWQLVQQLVVDQDYRVLHISPEQTEIWLEGLSNKKAPIIRLYRYDLDWSNWLQRDLEYVSKHVINFKKQLGKRSLSALNIYVSTYPPVDDWEFRVKEPYEANKIKIKSVVLHEGNIEHAVKQISRDIGEELKINEHIEMEELELYHLRENTLNFSAQKVQKEKQIFQQGKPFFTYIFILLHLVMFYLLETNGGSQNPETLIKHGAKFNPSILEGEWWRFFTPIVLHIGLLHLLLNTMALFYLGTAVERIYGNVRFLIIYLFAGFAGSLASFVFTSSLSAGASGAIFGCFGALLFIGLVHPKLFFRTMGANILVLIGINLAIGFTIPGIDNAGHIGGLIGGFLASATVHLPKHKKPIQRLLGFGLALVLTNLLINQGFHEENPNMLLNQAKAHIQQNEYQVARNILSKLEDREEEYPETLFHLSYINLQEGNYEEAIDQLERLVTLTPELHEAHYNLSLAYVQQQDWNNALESINKAIELDSTGENYQNVRAEIMKQLESE
ncbi:rhomboid family protein [Sutcliffiella rhizosphaerae]|uniref:Rhomboid protease GluP n=1 Tax=Sutcliffiella rhizosphaerae TaxID=2880967 RepID=A0ABN8A4H7_9BACI|nr:rhomboid family intramembrane serine protease [Sutcliffiella rhizosphaerae]CAG9619301.1 Rhomboid protease GluP [Sutcliffiella rhizosphaerae]